jgi:hypothetical protein
MFLPYLLVYVVKYLIFCIFFKDFPGANISFKIYLFREGRIGVRGEGWRNDPNNVCTHK